MAQITNNNGTLTYTINDNEITIDCIKVIEQRKGTGRILIDQLKTMAREMNLPIGLYADPQDETIGESDLKDFYLANGFDLDADDCDGKLFIWK